MSKVEGVRRSARFSAKEKNLYNEVSGDEESEDVSMEEEESDDEYVVTRGKGKKRTKQAKSKEAGPRKRTKRSAVDPIEMDPDFKENELYTALSNPDISIDELALEWLESFEEQDSDNKNTNTAICELINLILRSCGCITLLQPHDIANIDSSSDTVGELAISFKRQQYHEFPFASSNKELKFFRRNVLDFFLHLISLAHEKALLYRTFADERSNDDSEYSMSSSLMDQVLTWLSNLSSSVVRPFRFVSTLVLFTIQSEICEINRKVVGSLEKYKKQFDNLKKSKKGNQKGNKRFEISKRNVDLAHHQKETIDEYCTEIIETSFIHRYRDIDPQIRMECLKNLGHWMALYPEFFFQSSYLRYFGWLLSDPSSIVRNEASRALLKLYRFSNNGGQAMGMGFRQFTERFKKQLINMSMMDNDVNVRHNILSIFCELLKIGFLDNDDCIEVCLLFFEILDTGSGFGSSYDEKLKNELSKFLSILNSESVKGILEKYKILLEHYDLSQFGEGDELLDLKECVKIRYLIKFLSEVSSHYEERLKINNKTRKKDDNKIVAIIFENLYTLPSYANSWELLVKYLLLDFSAISVVSKNTGLAEEDSELLALKESLDLSDEQEKVYLMNFLLGSVCSILNRKRRRDHTETEDTRSSLFSVMINYLPQLQSYSEKSNFLYIAFIRIWNHLMSHSAGEGIYSTFQNMNQVASFNEISRKIFRYYRQFEAVDDVNSLLLEAYENLFENYLGSVNTAAIDGLSPALFFNDDIKLIVQNTVRELVSELKEILVAFSRTNHASYSSSLSQIEVCKLLVEVLLAIEKLVKIANYTNPNEELLGFSGDSYIFDVLFNGVLAHARLTWLFEDDVTEHQELDKINHAIKQILNLSLISVSWLLDVLIKISANQEENSTEGFLIDTQLKISSSCFNDAMILLENLSEIKVPNPLKDLERRFDIMVRLDKLKTIVSSYLIDFLVSIKIFLMRYKNSPVLEELKEFRNMDGLGKYSKNNLPPKIQNLMLDIYLFKEARYASLMGIVLDRNSSEDVNIGTIFEEHYNDIAWGCRNDKANDKTAFTSEEGLAKQEKEEEVWDAEKSLCLYTVKLFTLIQSSLVQDFVLQRLKLNDKKIGGLYHKIIQQNSDVLNSGGFQPKDGASSHSSAVASPVIPSPVNPSTPPSEFETT